MKKDQSGLNKQKCPITYTASGKLTLSNTGSNSAVRLDKTRCYICYTYWLPHFIDKLSRNQLGVERCTQQSSMFNLGRAKLFPPHGRLELWTKVRSAKLVSNFSSRKKLRIFFQFVLSCRSNGNEFTAAAPGKTSCGHPCSVPHCRVTRFFCAPTGLAAMQHFYWALGTLILQ